MDIFELTENLLEFFFFFFILYQACNEKATENFSPQLFITVFFYNTVDTYTWIQKKKRSEFEKNFSSREFSKSSQNTVNPTYRADQMKLRRQKLIATLVHCTACGPIYAFVSHPRLISAAPMFGPLKRCTKKASFHG